MRRILPGSRVALRSEPRRRPVMSYARTGNPPDASLSQPVLKFNHAKSTVTHDFPSWRGHSVLHG